MDLAKESVYWIFRIILIGVVLVFVILIVGSLTGYKIDINEVESYVIRNKIILDEDCLAYNNYRTKLGIIDKSKFNEDNLKGCINTDKGIIINLTYNQESEVISFGDENLIDKLEFCFDEETFVCIKKEYNLILIDNLKETPAKLIINTIKLT